MAIWETKNIHVIMNCTEPPRLVVDLAKVESLDDVMSCQMHGPKLVSCPKGVVETKERNRSTSKLNRMKF